MTSNNHFPSTPPPTVNGILLELMELRRKTQELENAMKNELHRIESVDDDGLEKVITLEDEFTWPFRTCKHKGWHESEHKE